MSRLDRSSYRHRDVPQLEAVSIAGATAGTGTDFEHPLIVVPDLTQLSNLPSGVKGSMPLNYMQIREFILTWEAAITGTATNFFTLNLNQYRAGAALVNTTVTGGATGSGLQTITPASMVNIFNGMKLSFTQGTAETVTVFNVTPTTFQVVLANSHTNGSAIVSVALASIVYSNGTNASAKTPIYLALNPHYLAPGDLITIARVSTGTGLASPAGLCQIDWNNYGNTI